MRFSYLELGLFLMISTLLSPSFLPPTFSQSKEPTKASSFVLDFEGHQLQTGTKYYILPIQSGNGGGGGLALSAKEFPCPYYIMQENLESSNGLPLRFFPVDSKQQTIALSSDVNIAFNAATVCVQSTVWRVGTGNDENVGRRYVVSNGVVGHFVGDGLSSWFKIERNESGNVNGYKIVFCPGVCSTCKFVCGSVGVFRENGKRWLGLNDEEPLLFVFKKAA